MKEMKAGIDYTGICVVFVCHDGKGKILLHKRSGLCRDEQHCWDSGGGQLEFNEGFEEAVRREIREEYCCEAEVVQYARTTNVRRRHDGQATHWVAVVFAVRVDPSQVKIGEPDKMDSIGWFTIENFPKPLHSMLARHIDSAKHLL